MELDVVAYDPRTGAITHLEPSLDADTWAKREQRFRKKFDAGRKYILPALFPWLPATTEIRQKAIFPSAGGHRRTLAGAQVQTVDEVIGEIRHAVACTGVASKAAVPERYPLLRTIQLVACGYYRLVEHGSVTAERFTDTPRIDVVTETTPNAPPDPQQ
jgi:hypothetical protein